MTDFIGDLEHELLAAAHRRAARRPRPRLAWRPVIALAAAAAVAAGALALRPSAGEHAAAPGPTDTLALRAPVPATTCDGGAAIPPASAPPIPAKAAPAEVKQLLGELRRPQAAADRLPIAKLARWLPVGDYDPNAVRLAPGGAVQLRIVPTNDIRTRAAPCGRGKGRGPGACLTGGGMYQAVCFTVAEIRAGRAFGLLDVTRSYARLVGLVPDGREWAWVNAAGKSRGLVVRGNTVEKYFRFLHPGDRLRFTLAAHPGSVAVLNATTRSGSASEAVQRLRSRLGIAATAADARRVEPGESVVYAATPESEAFARDVAKITGGTVASGAPPGEPVRADVVVVLRMR